MKTHFKITIFFVTLFISSSAIAITTDDLKYARPTDLFRRMQAACQQNNQDMLFSQLSFSFSNAIKTKAPAAKQMELFRFYCSDVNNLVNNKLGGQPEKANYYIKQSDRTNNGQRKTILCIEPKGQPSGSCSIQFDVAIENGELKRDEF